MKNYKRNLKNKAVYIIKYRFKRCFKKSFKRGFKKDFEKDSKNFNEKSDFNEKNNFNKEHNFNKENKCNCYKLYDYIKDKYFRKDFIYYNCEKQDYLKFIYKKIISITN